MKKNYKFLSSLALAGILSTSILGLPGYAATTTNTTRTQPVGVCSKIIKGTNIVPFVLSNREDKVTIKDIKDSGKFNMSLFKGSAIPSEDTVVCTGDYFKTTDGKDYTVVVYGDVDKDGSVTILDALEIQENRGNPNGHPLDEVQAIAANVVRADGSGVNILDALQLQEYRGKATETIIDKVHDADQEEVKEDCPYTVTVNDNGYINADNKAASKVGIKLDKTYNEDKTPLAIKVIDSNGNEIRALAKNNITIPKYTDYKEIDFDFSGVTEDQKLTIQVYETVDNKDVLVGSVVTELNTVVPAAAEVGTERCGTDAAKMSFNKIGKSDITKMYYTIVLDNASAPVWDATEKEFTGVRTQTKTISNSKLQNEFITDDVTKLVTNKAYKVYYKLENSYGSTSAVLNTNILKDTVSMNDQIESVGDIKVADLRDLTDNEAKCFSWQKVDDATGYSVTVYKDGDIIKESTTVTVNGSKVLYDVSGDIEEAGNYKINVIALGDANHPNAVAKMSGEVRVTALKEVTPVFAMNDDGNPQISWTDTNNEEDVVSYTVKVYKQQANGTYDYDNPTKTFTGITDTEKVLDTNDSWWEDNTVYKAEVIAVAQANQKVLVDSKATLGDFYEINPDLRVSKITEDTATLKLTTDVKINGQTPSYIVKTYEVRVGSDRTEPEYQKETIRTPEEKTDEDGKRLLVIDKLDNNKKYAFKLVANINGATGESAYIEGTTMKKAPTVRGLKVVKTEREAVVGTIYKNGNTVIIDGKKIVDITDNYSLEFQSMMAVIDTLNVDDVVTLEGNTVELTLPSEASDTTGTPVTFDASVKDKKIIINGASYEKIVQTSNRSDEQPAEVILKGNGARFETTDVYAKKITLTSGVIVNGNAKEYTVEAGANNVIINGIKVSTQQKTVVTAKAVKNIEVVANDKESNVLTFENAMDTNSVATSGKDALITFVSGRVGVASQQLGTVNIKTEGGSITVKQKDVEVASTLNVEVNSGEVEIGGDETEKAEAFTGDQNIIVTNKKNSTTTISTVSKAVVPEKLIGKTINVVEYTSENRATLEGVTGALTDVEFAAVQSYLATYSDLYRKATIKFTASQTVNSEEVIATFTITGEVNNMNLPNVK